LPDAAWSAIFLVMIISINMVGVKFYGELEYWFALIKILIVIVFVIIAICVTSGGLGGEVIGFKYWKDPGAFVDGGLGFVNVLLTAGFSFQGTEVVGVAAGEAQNPTKTVPRAIRNTFWRIIFFYITTIFLLGMCLPSTNPDLLNSGDNAATASFTLVFQLAGIEAGAHVINTIILTSVLSAANSAVYTCSRTLLGLSHDGNAPKFLGRTNRYGAPYCAVLVSCCVGFACVFASIYSASVAFNWFLNITAVSGFISWWGITFVHLRFRRAFVHQGRDLKDLPYKAFWFPIPSLFATALCFCIIFGQGYGSFTPHFDGLTFASSYIGIVPAIVCYILHKLITRSRLIPMDEIDFDTGRVTREEIEIEEAVEKVLPWYKKMINIIA
ncbi:amino acid permease/ SLC12A domain-containing protein, partial [Dichotomocladium elegans]